MIRTWRDKEAPMKRKMTKPMPPGTKKKNNMISEPQFGGPATFGMMNGGAFGGSRFKRSLGTSTYFTIDMILFFLTLIHFLNFKEINQFGYTIRWYFGS